MTRKTFTLPAEDPWGPATIVVADQCVECREADAEVLWNRAYAVCRACAEKWTAAETHARWKFLKYGPMPGDDNDKD